MEVLIEKTFYLVIFLIEVVAVLILLSGIMSVIGEMLDFSWKKALGWAAAVFGILWLRDFLKRRKQKAQEEIIEELNSGSTETKKEETKD